MCDRELCLCALRALTPPKTNFTDGEICISYIPKLATVWFPFHCYHTLMPGYQARCDKLLVLSLLSKNFIVSFDCNHSRFHFNSLCDTAESQCLSKLWNSQCIHNRIYKSITTIENRSDNDPPHWY